MLMLRIRKKLLAAGLAVLGVGLPMGLALAQPPVPPVPPIAGFEPPSVPAPAAAPQSSGLSRLKSLLPGRSNNANPYSPPVSANPLPIGNPSEPPIAEQISLPMEPPAAPAYPTVPTYPAAPAMPPVAQPLPTGPSAGPYAAPMPTAPTTAPAPAVVSQPIPGGCGCGQGKAPQATQYGAAQPEPTPRRGFFSRLFGR